MTPRCGTRAAIIAHLEFGEDLDGPCALADLAMRLEAERGRPQPQIADPAVVEDARTRADRLALLSSETLAWEIANPGFNRGFERPLRHLRRVS